MQYGLNWERESINSLIEKAILDADEKGVKVLSLGLLNQACSPNIFIYSVNIFLSEKKNSIRSHNKMHVGINFLLIWNL